MKKLLIAASTLAIMSFTANKVYNWHLGEAVTNVQDMKEWMMQDIEHGRIDPELGQYYIEYLDMTEERFLGLAEQFRSPHLWKKEDAEWKLRHVVDFKDGDINKREISGI